MIWGSLYSQVDLNEPEKTPVPEPKAHPDLIWEKIEYTDGEVYEGYINSETRKKEGYGTYNYGNGNSYEGTWKDDKRSGFGINRWASGDSYEGMYKDNKRSGFGIYHKAEGYSYEGMWEDGKKSGFGINRFADGELYEGKWKDDKRSGFGINRWADGTSYEGMWKDNLKSGFGIYHWANGEIYEGMWNDGRSGFGINRYTNGDSYIGMFKDDLRSGFGIYFGNNTDRDYYMMAGEWLEELPDGYIRTHWRDHSIGWGLFKKGEPIEETMKWEKQNKDWNGFRENLRLSDGSFYTGEYNTNGGDFVEGYGIRKYPDGSMYIGKFGKDFSRDTSASGIFVTADHEVTEYKGSSDEYARIMQKKKK